MLCNAADDAMAIRKQGLGITLTFEHSLLAVLNRHRCPVAAKF